MPELNLLTKYPQTKRNVEARAAATEEDRRIAKQFGKEFFDGTRNQGYGGYRYDGRWQPVVKDFQEHYDLTSSSKILDVGSGKGFMLHDFLDLIPGVSVAGLEISPYAIETTLEDIKPYMTLGSAEKLPYADRSFDLVIAINTVHNLKGPALAASIREIERVSRKHKFIVVDAYRNTEEKDRMMKWVLTAETILHVDDWIKLFDEVGYTGDYYWFWP